MVSTYDKMSQENLTTELQTRINYEKCWVIDPVWFMNEIN